jgi:hypothetical protein
LLITRHSKKVVNHVRQGKGCESCASGQFDWIRLDKKFATLQVAGVNTE